MTSPKLQANKPKPKLLRNGHLLYRGYIIKPAEPFTRSKYQFVHEEYDGHEDRRIGNGNTREECMVQIDEQINYN